MRRRYGPPSGSKTIAVAPSASVVSCSTSASPPTASAAPTLSAGPSGRITKKSSTGGINSRRTQPIAWRAYHEPTRVVDRATGPVSGRPVGSIGVLRRTGSGSRWERYGRCAHHGCRDGDARTGAVRFHRNNSGTDGHNHLHPITVYSYGGIHPYASRHHAHIIIGRDSDPEAHIHPGTAQRVTRPTNNLCSIRRAYF